MTVEHHPLTADRREIFLKELTRTGSPVAAASAATPWSTHKQGGLNTFRDLAKRDFAFAAEWDRAKDEALAGVEREIFRRAMEPPKRPVWERGELRGWTEDRNSSDKLLLRLAARLDPAWRERTSVEANINVEGVLLSITPVDVLLLDREDQQLLVNLLGKIADAKESNDDNDDVPRLPGGSGPDPAA